MSAVFDEAPSRDKLQKLLASAPIPDQLKADLWRFRFSREIPESAPAAAPAVSPGSALEVFRQVLAQVQGFSELGPRDRTATIQIYLHDVEVQMRRVVVMPWKEFEAAVVTRNPKTAYSGECLTSAIACGRRFLEMGMWPVHSKEFQLRY